MTLNDIAAELVAGCRENRAMENLDKLYAADAVSVEASDPMGMGREAHGLEAIKGKHTWWDSTFELIGGDISDPYPHGDDRFAVRFEVKTRNKETGEVSEMDEVAVYHVADGKIVREEFFYPTG
ncbi:nuclear transport factor 2 family protein [Ovoidimarina sediminis]|uniref:nuclear transport factor 2 family protein n=1 Tax=Ovoidimarina sediminis TaxID=3079856 RepID=UPI00291246A6|nr:nuclear transport factor 2 family protein [Rhodophyticola sp. MJ-SS7]MDU8945899.1 nuclear transport factor 2 family protein [Rhodophyticola sp. MJ-SS7]